jgi:hypothetical protein
LIEKAYAKFIGSYNKIEGGNPAYALEDMTGGFAEIIQFPKGKPSMTPGYTGTVHDVYKRKILKLLKGGNFASLGSFSPELAVQCSALPAYSYPGRKIGYTLVGNELRPDNQRPGYGLVGPHAYTILDAQEVKSKDGEEAYFLLKLRNPHGQGEWNGKFSDGDDYNWGRVDKDLRARDSSGSTDIDEGVFWIDMNDVMKYFLDIECCYFGLQDGTKFTYTHGVFPASLQSKGIKDTNSNVGLFQAYKFNVDRALNVEIPEGYGQNKCAAAFAVVIDGYDSEIDVNKGPKFYVWVYKVTDKDLENFTASFYQYHHDKSRALNSGRQVSAWAVLDPGTYIIIPTLETSPGADRTVPIPWQYAGKDIKYTIRLFTENETTLEPIEVKPPKALSPYEQLNGFGSDSLGRNIDLEGLLNNSELLDLLKGFSFSQSR